MWHRPRTRGARALTSARRWWSGRCVAADPTSACWRRSSACRASCSFRRGAGGLRRRGAPDRLRADDLAAVHTALICVARARGGDACWTSALRYQVAGSPSWRGGRHDRGVRARRAGGWRCLCGLRRVGVRAGTGRLCPTAPYAGSLPAAALASRALYAQLELGGRLVLPVGVGWQPSSSCGLGRSSVARAMSLRPARRREGCPDALPGSPAFPWNGHPPTPPLRCPLAGRAGPDV